MRWPRLVWLSLGLVGCGSITPLAPDGDATVAAPTWTAPDGGAGSARGPAACDKSCPPADPAEGDPGKRAAGHDCAKPPCDLGDQS
jgi:hypothetical protein